MSVKIVAMTVPSLAHSIYADRQVIKREGNYDRPLRGLYLAQEGESLRVLKDDLLFYSDDVVAVLPKPMMGFDVGLFEMEDWVKEIGEQRGIRPAKNLYKPLKYLSPDEFQVFVKFSCILRRWYREVFTKRDKVYTLFSALMSSKKDFLMAYYSLRTYMSASELFSSILTFLARIDLYEEQRELLGDFYRKVVRRGRGQNMNFARAAQKLLRTPNEVDLDSRLIQFCFNLRG